MNNNDMLDAVLHANAPMPLPQVRKLIIESEERLIDEFLEDLKSIPQIFNNKIFQSILNIIEKWEAKKNADNKD